MSRVDKYETVWRWINKLPGGWWLNEKIVWPLFKRVYST